MGVVRTKASKHYSNVILRNLNGLRSCGWGMHLDHTGRANPKRPYYR